MKALNIDGIITVFVQYLRENNRFIRPSKNEETGRSVSCSGVDFRFWENGRVDLVVTAKSRYHDVLEMHLADPFFFQKALKVVSLVHSRPFSARYGRLDVVIKEILHNA